MALTCENCGSDDLVYGDIQWDEEKGEWYQEAECVNCGGHTEVEY